MPNICIIPSADRSGQANLIHHYCKIGWNVYLPKHETGNLNWKKTATWPGLLCRSLKNPNYRNLDLHGFKRTEDNIFGEDRFIQLEDNGPLYEDQSIVCELVDFEKEAISIDAFHTLRGSDDYLRGALALAKKHFPDAVWISSTISPYSQAPPLGIAPENVCRMMPAKYIPDYSDKNFFDFYPSGFEFDLLNVQRNKTQRSGFASFNHNFQLRYPEEFKFFKKLNKKLYKSGITIPNFGGNTIGQGADIKYSQAGFTKIDYASLRERFLLFFKGAHHFAVTWPTLSIRQAAKQNTALKAVVIFKENDYGSGVVWYALTAGTPIITHQRYVDATNAHDIIIHDYNSIIVNSVEEAADAVLKLEDDPEYLNKLCQGMKETFVNLTKDGYWDEFRKFIHETLTAKKSFN
jgi:hypothetical protein